MMHRLALLLMVLAAIAFGLPTAHAALINGDFESGDFTGWTTFTTETGVISGNQPAGVFAFDVDGDGNFSQSARFQVGVRGGRNGGGGIFQVVTSSLPFTVQVDIAASSTSNNATAGLFELLVDNVVLDFHDFGSIDVGVIKRSSLSSSIIAAGSHEIRLRMTRPAGAGATPFQRLDNVELTLVPEPTASTLTLLAIFGLLPYLYRQPVSQSAIPMRSR